MAWKKVICCCASPKINLVDEGEWVEPILPRRTKKKQHHRNMRKGMTRSDIILTSSGEMNHNTRLSIIKEQLSPLLVEEEETASLTEESSGASSSELGSDSSDEMQPEEAVNDNIMHVRSRGGYNTRRGEDSSDIMQYVDWYSSTTPSPVARRKMNQRLGAS